MKTDWHIHTQASDGIFSLSEILLKAQQADLTEIALTDHDTMDSWTELIQEAHPSIPLTITSGVEFGAYLSEPEWEKEEVHILGYGLNPTQSELRFILEKLSKDRKERFSALLARAAYLGYQIRDEILENVLPKNSVPGRLHLARILVESGYFNSIPEVFQEYLAAGKPGYIGRFRQSPQEICQLIKQAGGVAILAHPYEIKSERLRNLLLESDLFDGVEAIHPSHGYLEVERLLEWGRKWGKLVSGGSDFHGLESRFPKELGIFYPPSKAIQPFLNRVKESPFRRYLG